jgi:probable regulatory domain-containing protein
MVTEIEPVEASAEALVQEVLFKAIEVAGGLRKLVQYRNLTWVPSLIEAAYIVVLHDHFHRSTDEIAQYLGVSSATVRNVLRASTEGVLERLESAHAEHELKTHIAGGLAKLAYEELKKAGKVAAPGPAESPPVP